MLRNLDFLQPRVHWEQDSPSLKTPRCQDSQAEALLSISLCAILSSCLPHSWFGESYLPGCWTLIRSWAGAWLSPSVQVAPLQQETIPHVPFQSIRFKPVPTWMNHCAFILWKASFHSMITSACALPRCPPKHTSSGDPQDSTYPHFHGRVFYLHRGNTFSLSKTCIFDILP